MKITFAQQAEKFLQDGAIRKRNPLRQSTLRTYRAQIETHLIPKIGKLKLQDVGNKVVSRVVTDMASEGLSAGTIQLNVVIIKKIRRSAVNEDGDSLFPISWNSDVIDAPEISPKQPTICLETLETALQRANAHDKALYALLGSTGLRIAEARALTIGPDDGVNTVWIPSESKVIVRQQATRDGFGPTKTKAGKREVDLNPELNDFLIKQVGDRMGPLFPNCETCYADHLKANGIGGGFHVFRRFRITHLKLQGVPDPLIKFWVGHTTGNDITEHYTQVGGEIQSRKDWAAKAGVGFKLPEIV
jgi:integrase